MSYPIDLDEMDEAKLVQEIERRKKTRAEGLCDYCGRTPDARSCKFPDRHKEKVEQGGEWYCRNCGYLSASRVTYHETCDECHIPVEWHDLDKMTAFESMRDALQTIARFKIRDLSYVPDDPIKFAEDMQEIARKELNNG